MKKKTKNTVDKHPDYKEGGVTGKGWLPGQSGNPKGRPKKGNAWAELIRIKGDEMVTLKGGRQMTKREAIIAVAYVDAMRGDSAARIWLKETDVGKAILPILDDEETIIQFLWESETGELTEEESNGV